MRVHSSFQARGLASNHEFSSSRPRIAPAWSARTGLSSRSRACHCRSREYLPCQRRHGGRKRGARLSINQRLRGERGGRPCPLPGEDRRGRSSATTSDASARAELLETAIDIARPYGRWRRCVRVRLRVLHPRRGKAEMSDRRRRRRFYGLALPDGRVDVGFIRLTSPFANHPVVPGRSDRPIMTIHATRHAKVVPPSPSGLSQSGAAAQSAQAPSPFHTEKPALWATGGVSLRKKVTRSAIRAALVFSDILSGYGGERGARGDVPGWPNGRDCSKLRGCDAAVFCDSNHVPVSSANRYSLVPIGAARLRSGAGRSGVAEGLDWSCCSWTSRSVASISTRRFIACESGGVPRWTTGSYVEHPWTRTISGATSCAIR